MSEKAQPIDEYTSKHPDAVTDKDMAEAMAYTGDELRTQAAVTRIVGNMAIQAAENNSDIRGPLSEYIHDSLTKTAEAADRGDVKPSTAIARSIRLRDASAIRHMRPGDIMGHYVNYSQDNRLRDVGFDERVIKSGLHEAVVTLSDADQLRRNGFDQSAGIEEDTESRAASIERLSRKADEVEAAAAAQYEEEKAKDDKFKSMRDKLNKK